MWNLVYHFFGLVTDDYLSLASRWLNEKKIEMAIGISTGVMWGLWLMRNDFVF